MGVTFPNDDDTSSSWPEWTWREFNAYWSDNLSPITPIPGHLTQSRDTTILEAWQHPIGASGIYVAFHDRLRRLVDHDAYFAARSAYDESMQRLTPEVLTTALESNVAALIIPDVFLVAINATSGAQPIVNVVGVKNAGGTAAGAAAAVRTAFKVASGPLAKHAGQYVLSSFKAMDISSANGAIAEVTDSAPGGLGSATGLATNAASALVKWNGGTRSASSRGRLYHGPLMENEINSDGRTLQSGVQIALDTAYEAMLASLNSAGYPLVVVSRKNATATVVNDVSVQGVIATQRRRIR